MKTMEENIKIFIYKSHKVPSHGNGAIGQLVVDFNKINKLTQVKLTKREQT